MINWIGNSGIMEVAFVITLLTFSSCRKEGETTTVEGFAYDSTNAQKIPLSGVRVSAGHFGYGGGVLSGGSKTYATTYSDNNGHYKLVFEANNGSLNIYSHSDRPGYTSGRYENHTIEAGRHTTLDLYFYRFETTLSVELERIPPLSDTLALLSPVPRTTYPNQAANPIHFSDIRGNRYIKIRWDVLNGTRQQYIDSIYCPNGDTTRFLLRF